MEIQQRARPKLIQSRDELDQVQISTSSFIPTSAIALGLPKGTSIDLDIRYWFAHMFPCQ